MSNYTRFPETAGGIKIYPSAVDFPADPGKDGVQAVAADTNTIYIFDSALMSWQAVATPGAAIAIDALTGDVSATGPGAVPATVNSVGGASAVDIAASVSDTQAATNLATPSTLAKRDASAGIQFKSVEIPSPASFALKTYNSPLTNSITIDPSSIIVKNEVSSDQTFINPTNVYINSGNRTTGLNGSSGYLEVREFTSNAATLVNEHGPRSTAPGQGSVIIDSSVPSLSVADATSVAVSSLGSGGLLVNDTISNINTSIGNSLVEMTNANNKIYINSNIPHVYITDTTTNVSSQLRHNFLTLSDPTNGYSSELKTDRLLISQGPIFAQYGNSGLYVTDGGVTGTSNFTTDTWNFTNNTGQAVHMSLPGQYLQFNNAGIDTLFRNAGITFAEGPNHAQIEYSTASGMSFLGGSALIISAYPFDFIGNPSTGAVVKSHFLTLKQLGTGREVELNASALSSSYSLALPPTVGTLGQVLATDGIGSLSWVNLPVFSGANTALSNLTSPTAVNQQLLSAVGSAAAPSYSYSGNTGTGAFSPAANVLGFSTNGTEKMRIDSAGNVAIGTTTTSGAALTLYSTLGNAMLRFDVGTGARPIFQEYYRNAARLGFVGYPSSSNSSLVLWNQANDYTSIATNNVERIRVLSGGNVGIGTITPNEKLEVSGNVRSGGLRLAGATSGVLSINPTATVTSYAITMPAAQGAASTVLQNDGAGNLSWASVQPAGNYITALTGDVTASGPGSAAATIANSAVTNAKMANMAANTIKGNNTGLAAAPIDLTATQTTAMLDVFTSALKGLAPASGGGTANFLRADGTWAAPAGTGANTALSNLTTTAINQDLLFAKAAAKIEADNTQTSITNATLTIKAGNGLVNNRGKLNLLVTSNNGSLSYPSAGLTIDPNISSGYDGAAVMSFSSGSGRTFDVRVDAGNVQNNVAISQGGQVFLNAYNGGSNVDEVKILTSNSAKLTITNSSSTFSNTVQVPNYILSPQLNNAGTKTADFTLDFATGPCQQATIDAAGPLILTLSNPVTGGAYLIKLVQGATPGTITWPVNVKFGSAGTPTLSAVTGKIDIINLYYDGTDYYATYALGF